MMMKYWLMLVSHWIIMAQNGGEVSIMVVFES